MNRADLKQWADATGCAESAGTTTFLCDPRWTAADRERVNALQTAAKSESQDDPSGWLCVATGGSSGGVRFARHDEKTLAAAVDGFVRHFGLARVNAVDVLPAFHVSGFMARVRCAATGGEHRPWDWKRLEAGERPAQSGPDWVLSLVPTQLQRLLAAKESVAWLRGFRIIFLGGAPVWPQLADQAAAAGLRISLTYGMTETAAMVAGLRPEEFLAGERSSGAALPHARITLAADAGVVVHGESVFRGYFPERRTDRSFHTEDLAEIDGRGRITVLGRRDATIITGGKKVQPAEIEAVLRATGCFSDVAVAGVPSAEWGEEVVAFYPADAAIAPNAALEQRLRAELAPAQRPKRMIAVPLAEWPRNAQGKVVRSRLVRWAERAD